MPSMMLALAARVSERQVDDTWLAVTNTEWPPAATRALTELTREYAVSVPVVSSVRPVVAGR
jgi:hypothetical protein